MSRLIITNNTADKKTLNFKWTISSSTFVEQAKMVHKNVACILTCSYYCLFNKGLEHQSCLNC